MLSAPRLILKLKSFTKHSLFFRKSARTPSGNIKKKHTFCHHSLKQWILVTFCPASIIDCMTIFQNSAEIKSMLQNKSRHHRSTFHLVTHCALRLSSNSPEEGVSCERSKIKSSYFMETADSVPPFNIALHFCLSVENSLTYLI